jgi:hypothetical protein
MQPCKKVIVKKPQRGGGQSPNWAVQPYDYDDDDDFPCKNMTVFWDVAPCSLITTSHCFSGVYCLHHQGEDVDSKHI